MTIFKIFAISWNYLNYSGLSHLNDIIYRHVYIRVFLFIDFPWQGFIDAGNFTDYPIWVFGLLMFFAVGIPFFS
jgi:hypothetical protein